MTLDGGALDAGAVSAVASGGAIVRLAPATRRRVARCRRLLEQAAADGAPHYGVNTGFGSLARQRIAATELAQLQRNLVRSHAAGAGAPLPDAIVRATMLCLAASLARAHSGVRPEVIEQLLAFLNAGLTPVVPEIGSVGASGDLAPLAHIALPLMGEGWVSMERNVLAKPPDGSAGRPSQISATEALRRAKLSPLEFAAKEGLALINGTHLMTARLALLRAQWDNLLPAALIATAMSLDACRATDAFLDPRVYAVRNQPGAARVAAELRRLIRGSRIVVSHVENDPRVQDPYSFRCAPIVLGAACDALAGVWSALDHELGAVTDNPLVFPDRDTRLLTRDAQTRHTGREIPATQNDVIVSAGNFHGMPIALPLDILAIAVAHVAGIAERRIYYMLSAFDPEMHLKPFLTPRPGLNSGLMVSQYTAAAACNELIGLAAPASVANLPTCAGMEDYNSFGPRSAAKAERAFDLVTTVVAIELLCAAQGLEHHRPLQSSRAVETAHEIIRRRVKRLTDDRPLAPDIEAIRRMILAGEFRPLAKPI